MDRSKETGRINGDNIRYESATLIIVAFFFDDQFELYGMNI